MPQPRRPRGRRRVRKNVPFGQAHIKMSFNNTIVSLSDKDGNVIAWESAGGAGFKGSRKSTPFAAQVTADAAARKGMENGLQRVESRFDNVLVRLGFAASRRQARQMIRHGHWAINGRRVNIPSYQLRPDDVITMKPNAPVEPVVRDATELTSVVPAWLQADHDGLTAKVLRLPERAEITTPVQEQLIVELYSK